MKRVISSSLLLATVYWSRDEDGIWMIIECQYFYYSPPY